MVGIDDRQENSVHTLTDTGRSTNCAQPGRNSIDELRSRVPFALTFPDIEKSNSSARILVFSSSLVGRRKYPDGSRMMRRGSMQTWESFGRRHSSAMAQYSNSRSEFMTSDLGLNDIEYERKGGFFMTNKKTALVVCAIVLIVIATGFVGAYIGSIPKEKHHDTLALLDVDVACDNNIVSSKFSLSETIRPSRYRVELSPITETGTVYDEPITRLRGHLVVEFQYNGTENLEAIVLNARRMNLTKTKLVTLVPDKSINSRKRRNPQGKTETKDDKIIMNATEVLPITSTPEVSTDRNDLTTSLMENDTMVNENRTDDSTTNPTIFDDNKQIVKTVSEASEDKVKSSVSDDANRALTEEDVLHPKESNSSIPETKESSASESVEENKSTEIEISKSEYDDDGGFIVLYPATPIEARAYSLEIDYEVSADGYAIVFPNKSAKWLPDVEIKPTSIRNFFPVFDDMRMKARFTLTVPRLRSVNIYSNMPIETTALSSDDWVLDTFEETPPISPKNLAVIATGNLETLGQRSINNTRVTFLSESLKSGAGKHLMDIVEIVIVGFLDLFGRDFPVPKLDVLGLRDVDHDSSYPGLITIEESLYGVSENSPGVSREHAYMKMITLIGQQWLGGLVNTRNSSDAWIIKSSLLYLHHYLMKELTPVFNHSTFLMDVQPFALEAGGYSVSRSLESMLSPSHSSTYHANDAYAIGACLIRLLHDMQSQTEFRDGYKSFVSRWFGGNADRDSFWKSMTSSAKNESVEDVPNFYDIMSLWTKENGYPAITVTRNYETESAVVRQQRFTYNKPSSTTEQFWIIPLSWITNGSSQSDREFTKPEASITIDISNKSWVVFNPTKAGYFRVNYDEENWKLLAQELRQNHEIFSAETRATLVDDVFSFGFVGLVPYSTVFDVIGYLPENEKNPEPWTYLLQHAVKLNLALYDSPVYPNYQEFMQKFLSDLYTKVGSKIEEGTRLTLISHQLACIFDHPDYFVWAKNTYIGFENTTGLPIKNNVPSYLHKNLLCAFAKLEHELGWRWWQKKFTNVTNREERNSLLSSLACFQVPSMLQAVLNEIVYSTSFTENDALVILEYFSYYPAASQTALQFVEGNWRNITTRYPKSCRVVSAFLDAASTGFTGTNDIEDIFREKNYESLKKVGYAAALLEAKANASVSFLQTSLDDFRQTIENRTTF